MKYYKDINYPTGEPITEQSILNLVNRWCQESLSPDNFEKWEDVVKGLIIARKDLSEIVAPNPIDQRAASAPLHPVVGQIKFKRGNITMKSTHWSHSDDPEKWTDNPEKTPEEAARQLIENEDSDLACDIRDDLLRVGPPIEITVYGYVETNEVLDPEVAFDGYKPGCTYFTPTDEEITIVAE
jgi:hypothetical protein